MDKIGPTGEYPAGAISPDDKGGLRAVVSVDAAHRRIEVNFGTMLSWLSMTPEEAMAFGQCLIIKAGEIL